MPLHKWLQAIYLCGCGTKPLKPQQLSTILGVSYKTAGLMIRRMTAAAINSGMLGCTFQHTPLSGDAECVGRAQGPRVCLTRTPEADPLIPEDQAFARWSNRSLRTGVIDLTLGPSNICRSERGLPAAWLSGGDIDTPRCPSGARRSKMPLWDILDTTSGQ